MITIVQIVFGQSNKQYYYLLANENVVIKRGKKYKINSKENITITNYFVTDKLPPIVTSAIKIDSPTDASLHRLSYEQITKLRQQSIIQPIPAMPRMSIPPKPKIPNSFWCSWQVYIATYNEYKQKLREDSGEPIKYYKFFAESLIKLADHLIELITKYDCTEFFNRSITLTVQQLEHDKEQVNRR